MAATTIAEALVSKEARPQVIGPAPSDDPRRTRSAVEGRPTRARALFNDALLENHTFKSTFKTSDLLVALLFHVAVIGGPILAGLYYRDTLNLKAFATTLLVASPPPAASRTRCRYRQGAYTEARVHDWRETRRTNRYPQANRRRSYFLSSRHNSWPE